MAGEGKERTMIIVLLMRCIRPLLRELMRQIAARRTPHGESEWTVDDYLCHNRRIIESKLPKIERDDKYKNILYATNSSRQRTYFGKWDLTLYLFILNDIAMVNCNLTYYLKTVSEIRKHLCSRNVRGVTKVICKDYRKRLKSAISCLCKILHDRELEKSVQRRARSIKKERMEQSEVDDDLARWKTLECDDPGDGAEKSGVQRHLTITELLNEVCCEVMQALVIRRAVDKGHRSLQSFLNKYENRIRRRCDPINEEKLFPRRGESNPNDWDTTLLCFVLYHICFLGEIKDEHEQPFIADAVWTFRRIRNDTVHKRKVSLSKEEYNSYLESIKGCITHCLNFLNDEGISDCILNKIEDIENKRIDNDETIRRLQMALQKERNEHALQEKYFEGQVSIQKELSEIVRGFKGVNLPEIQLELLIKNCSQESEEMLSKMLVQEINNTIARNEPRSTDDDEMTLAVAKLINSWRSKGWNPVSSTKGSVLLNAQCVSFDKLCELYYTFGKTVSSVCVEDIQTAARRLTGDNVEIYCIMYDSEMNKAMENIVCQLLEITEQQIARAGKADNNHRAKVNILMAPGFNGISSDISSILSEDVRGQLRRIADILKKEYGLANCSIATHSYDFCSRSIVTDKKCSTVTESANGKMTWDNAYGVINPVNDDQTSLNMEYEALRCVADRPGQVSIYRELSEIVRLYKKVTLPEIQLELLIKNCSQESKEMLSQMLVQNINNTIAGKEPKLTEDDEMTLAVAKLLNSWRSKGWNTVSSTNGSVLLNVQCLSFDNLCDLFNTYGNTEYTIFVEDLQPFARRLTGDKVEIYCIMYDSVMNKAMENIVCQLLEITDQQVARVCKADNNHIASVNVLMAPGFNGTASDKSSLISEDVRGKLRRIADIIKKQYDLTNCSIATSSYDFCTPSLVTEERCNGVTESDDNKMTWDNAYGDINHVNDDQPSLNMEYETLRCVADRPDEKCNDVSEGDGGTITWNNFDGDTFSTNGDQQSPSMENEKLKFTANRPGTRAMDKIKQTVANWKRSRETTISSLRHCANVLRTSHKENAKSEYKSASASLVGDLVGLGGIFLAPFSGGLSLAAVGVSSVVGIGSYINKRGANTQNENQIKDIQDQVDTAIEHDKQASESLKSITQKLEFLEDQLYIMRIDDIISSLEDSALTNIKFRAKEIRTSDLENKLRQQKNTTMSIPGLDLSKQAANLNAALTSAEHVVKYSSITKRVFTGTRTIRQVVSTAQSVNKVTQTAKSLAMAKQVAVMTIQGSQSMAKSTVAFANVARGADGVVKTTGVVASANKFARVAFDIVTASEQAASAAISVTHAAKAGTVISTATKCADITFKTVKDIKQASDTVKTVTQVTADSGKAIRTTRITTNAARLTKVSETATKVASISKVGLAINAVVIPVDIYNLIQASDSLDQYYEDVQHIENLAKELEEQMNETTREIEGKCELVHQLHVQLSKMYEDHHIELIFDYLKLTHENLDFDIPLHK